MFKLKYYFLLVCLIPVISGCSKNKPHISMICEENEVGNNIIKWEISPRMLGKVKVYASDNPNNFKESQPVALSDIKDQQLTIITDNPLERKYYLALFNNNYPTKVAARHIKIHKVQNFRDLGGYTSYRLKKHIKWGMIYRSGDLSASNRCSLKQLKNLKVKTILDLRDMTGYPSRNQKLQHKFNIKRIPINVGNLRKILTKLEKNKIHKSEVEGYIKQMNIDVINNSQSEIKKIFEVLLEEDNYPLVIESSIGKEKVGIITALVLGALKINESTIINDYLLTNRCFNILKTTEFGYKLPTISQEAITSLFSAQESFIKAPLKELKSNYGGIESYLEKQINLTPDKLKTLQSILLE